MYLGENGELPRRSYVLRERGFSGGSSGGQVGDGGRSCCCFFFMRLGWGGGPAKCIFHFPAEAVASATACRAFCSLVGDGESKSDSLGDSLMSLLQLEGVLVEGLRRKWRKLHLLLSFSSA